MKLQSLLTKSIFSLAQTAAAFYLPSPAGRRFVAGILPALKLDAAIRAGHEKHGVSIPPFLIASITSGCNLRCAGCYAKNESSMTGQLSPEQWNSIFEQADKLGISVILLAGGEPFLRPDLLDLAARTHPTVIFPVFTNGTLMDDNAFELLARHRNLIPVFSLEGDLSQTDARRGDGVFGQVEQAMARLARERILFGCSVTVTKENLHSVTCRDYAAGLAEKGCGLLFYVEYVPVEQGSGHLALSPEQAVFLNESAAALRQAFSTMSIVSFPGDEAALGGCLAAGRGFFHINARGGAEPCPFSPYSQLSLDQHTLLEVLSSPFFAAVRQLESNGGHEGGCALLGKEDVIRQLLQQP